MKQTEQSVLEAWHLVEALAPHPVPTTTKWKETYFIDQQARPSLHEFRLTLTEAEPVFEEVKLEKGSYQYIYYCDCYPHYQLVEILRDRFNVGDELVNRSKQLSYSFSFSVNHKGQYIKSSLVVPFMMYLLNNVGKVKQTDYKEMEERFNRAYDSLELKTQAILMNGITQSTVQALQDEYARFFFKMETKGNGAEDTTRHYRELKLNLFKNKRSEQESQKPVPNFYIGDLQKILTKGKINQALAAYISGLPVERRLHIDENRTYIENILQPINLPNGRWPSPVEHRLSLMQQVAVNQFFVEHQKVSSVNGPPGTGKTTLLKDVFANLVVNRANELAKLERPEDLFIDVHPTIKLGRYSYKVSKLNPTIDAYSMVVASSNNGAVENISKDLPKKSEVIRANTSEFDQHYAQEATAMDLFSKVASKLLSENETIDTWGLFSVPLGKASNINEFAQSMFASKGENESLSEEEKSFSEHLLNYKQNVTHDDWSKAVNEFNDLKQKIEEQKTTLQELFDEHNETLIWEKDRAILKESIAKCELQLEEVTIRQEEQSKKRELVNEQISILPKRSFWTRLFSQDGREIRLKEELFHILDELKKVELDKKRVNEQRRQLEDDLSVVQDKIAAFQQRVDEYQLENLILPTHQYWDESREAYASRHMRTPWLTHSLNYDRGLLFLKAMKLHKITLALNANEINAAMRLLRFRNELNLNDATHLAIKKEVLKTIHLITPLISTTFASFSSMYQGVEEDFIDYLFIDEAGQATPQQAAGAIWRSKRVFAVGDPLQIEPVITTDDTILSDVRKYYEVSEEHVGVNASVQSLADHANARGMNAANAMWMGIPLWVHRRCSNPMFSIANEIAYENKMVLAGQTETYGTINCKWYDCKGDATERQFVKEQGELLIALLKNQQNNAGDVPHHYVITPFTAVKNGLKKMFRANGFSEKWVKECVGTVHTFQGKEADVVYFVVGTDESTQAAADWSCKQPNLINVAVTRAKKEFHLIGDYHLLSPKANYSTIAKYADVVTSQRV